MHSKLCRRKFSLSLQIREAAHTTLSKAHVTRSSIMVPTWMIWASCCSEARTSPAMNCTLESEQQSPRQNSVTHTHTHASALNSLTKAHVSPKQASEDLAFVTSVAPPSQPVLSSLLAPIQPCFCLGSAARSVDHCGSSGGLASEMSGEFRLIGLCSNLSTDGKD